MASDDMHVVMYKILAYLYSCMKSGERPERRHYWFDGDVLSIPEAYWARVMRELSDNGLVSGFVFVVEWGGGVIVRDVDPAITMRGVEFLRENSMMRKALAFLRETKSALPFL